jgi:uncharacterized membrane protein
MTSNPGTVPRLKEIFRVILSVSIVKPIEYASLVPPQFGDRFAMVYISGFFEILGGIGLLIPFVSVAAAWGLIALFIAVFPANIYQAIHSIPIEGIPHHPLFYWFRLPFQAVFIAWAWWYTRKPEEQPGASSVASLVESSTND